MMLVFSRQKYITTQHVFLPENIFTRFKLYATQIVYRQMLPARLQVQISS
jgi:hypothetical protein